MSTPTTAGGTSYQLSGMTCQHAHTAVINEVSQVGGVRQVTVDLAAGLLTVHTSTEIDRDLLAAVDEAGCALQRRPLGHKPFPPEHRPRRPSRSTR